MAERIVSPAVFTNEIDSTYLVEGIGAIGGAIVGPFNKGPAYSPTVVTSLAELTALFGIPTGTYYQPLTAREYLLQQGVVTIVRTGGLEGWKNEYPLVIRANYESGSLEETEDSPLLGRGWSEGDMPTKSVVIGVLANTLIERGTLNKTQNDPDNPGKKINVLDDRGNVIKVPGELILKANLASPSKTSIGFQGSKLFTTDGDDMNLGPIPFSKGNTKAELSLSMSYNPEVAASSNDEFEPEMVGSYRFDLNPASPDSLQNIFGRSPQRNKKPGYFTSYFESSQQEIFNWIENHGATFNISIQIDDAVLDFQDETQEDIDPKDGLPDGDAQGNLKPYEGADERHVCRPASTPWIKSQEISGSRYELFRLHTRSYGKESNKEVKVGFYNIKTPGTLDGTDYGTFSVIVREFNDNDKTQNVIEDFRNVTLDPMSARFLPRVIGDRFTYINEMGKIIDRGDYGNGSDWVRVEMPADQIAPTQCMPYGHDPYKTPFGYDQGLPPGDDGILDLPEPKYNHHSQYSTVPRRYFNGAIFNEDSPDGVLVIPNWSKDTHELFAPIPENYGHAGAGYYLDDFVSKGIVKNIDDEILYEDAKPIETSPNSPSLESDARGARRFMVGFQGGEDGHSPVQPILLGEDISAKNVQGMDLSKRKSSGSQAYRRAFQALSNQDEFDINLLVTPGLNLEQHRSIVNEGVDLCETREDCFYILDVVSADGQPGKVDEAVTEASTIDSNYAATYYPWVKIIDPSTNSLQAYPPSAIMPAVYAANDKTAAEWFAPAGLNRGGLEQAISVMDRLTFAERDTLYEGKVNPIAQFPGQGIVAFGQKTLQRRSSALDRINVRRLLITLKKFIASTSRYLLFEQNTAATRNKFLAIVNPYLEAVQQRQGLYAFNVVMDESNNTPDLIDRNILYGQIFLQPARAVEFIILDFNLQATGATFG